MSEEIILQGFNQFKERLKPAVLTDTKVNSNIIGAWLVSNGIDVNVLTTPEEVADALYRATVANFPRLVWTVKPAKLQLMEKEGKAQIQKSAAASDAEFADKVKKNEAAEADKKAEDAAQKSTIQIIGSFSLTGGGDGRPMYGKTADFQTKLRARVQRLRRSGRKWVDIERDIRDKVNELYDANERANERVGFYEGGLLAQVEV